MSEIKKSIEELIEVFKKLKAENKLEEVIEDKQQIKNIELLINNYDFLKHSVPDEMLESIGGNLKELILEITVQMKTELSEDSLSEKENNISNIEKIDRLLENKDLTEQEVNDLLDKRSNL